MKHPLIKLSKKQIENINKLNTDSRIKFNKISCLNCGSQKHMNLFTKDRYGLNVTKVLCNECGLMFINPMMSQNSSDFLYSSDLYRNILHDDEKEKFNTENWNKFEKTGGHDIDEKSTFFNVINSLNIEYHTVCDVGAGNGQNVSLFKSIGKEACGYEPSEYFSD